MHSIKQNHSYLLSLILNTAKVIEKINSIMQIIIALRYYKRCTKPHTTASLLYNVRAYILYIERVEREEEGKKEDVNNFEFQLKCEVFME